MTRIFRQGDADPSLLEGVTVGVVGFGNQGAAQALCLRDAGIDVRVLVRPGGPSAERVAELGFPSESPEALAGCAVIALLIPDEDQPALLDSTVRAHAPPGALLVFAHGFALRHGDVSPRRDLDVALVGPRGPGSLLRRRFEEGTGLPGLLAVVQDATGTARNRALAYASALRMTRAGLWSTSLDEEVVSDLFAEQVVLCGGVTELIRAAWETLVAEGVSEEIAYTSCVQELKQILDLVSAHGLAGMRAGISGTAQYGGLTRGPRLIGEATRAEMRKILDEVRNGEFAREWMRERRGGSGRLGELLSAEADHPLEAAGRRVREALGGLRESGGVDSPGGET